MHTAVLFFMKGSTVMGKSKPTKDQIRWVQYSAQLACLAMLRQEDYFIDYEEYLHCLMKVRENYRDLLDECYRKKYGL